MKNCCTIQRCCNHPIELLPTIPNNNFLQSYRVFPTIMYSCCLLPRVVPYIPQYYYCSRLVTSITTVPEQLPISQSSHYYPYCPREVTIIPTVPEQSLLSQLSQRSHYPRLLYLWGARQAVLWTPHKVGRNGGLVARERLLGYGTGEYYRTMGIIPQDHVGIILQDHEWLISRTMGG